MFFKSIKNYLLFLAVLCSLLNSQKAVAQYDKDYGFTVGAVSYLGDIGGKEDEARPWLLDLKLESTRWNLGVYGRKRLSGDLYGRFDLGYVRLEGADSLSQNPARVGRNLSFRNDIFGASIRGEYVFYSDFDVGNSGSYETNLSLYAGAGVGVFYHNPKAKYQGKWHALQPLQLEGQEYKKIQASMPISLGLHYTIRKEYRVGFEVGYVFTFTDYLDDVSGSYIDTLGMSDIQKALISRPVEDDINGSLPLQQNYEYPSPRGDHTDDDGYFFATVTIGKVIKGKYKNKKFNPHKRRYKYISSKRKKKRTKAKF